MAKFPVTFNFRAFEQMSATIDRINGKFGAMKERVRQVNNRFAVMKTRTDALRRSLNRVGRGFQNVGRTLTTFVSLPLLALGGRFIKVASDAEETANKFGEVFKEVSKGAQENAVRKLTDEFKLSTRNAQDFLATTGLIAQGLDLNSQQSLELATTLSALSQDVASFRNVQGGAADVLNRFTTALTGERESLKKLGIVITEDLVKRKAQELAAKGQRFETLQQAKAFATLAIIQERTAKDMGDFQRTMASFSNQMRVASERFDEVSRVIGNILKPIAAELLQVVNDLMQKFLDLSPAGQKMVVIFGAIAIAVGPILLIFGKVLSSIGFMVMGFNALAAVLPAGITILGTLGKVLGVLKFAFLGVGKAMLFLLTNPVGLVITGIGLLVAGVVRAIWIWDELVASFKAGQGILESISNVFKTFFGMGDEKTITIKKEGDDSAQSTAETARRARVAAQAFRQETTRTNNASVVVDFRNAPKGTRVNATSSDGLPPDLNLGFAGGF